jgi:hypothetical protein
MLDHSFQSGRHPPADRGADLYETPGCAMEALLRVEQSPHWLWEPAAARGAVCNVLRDRGHAVIASDLVDYGFQLHFVPDFLATTKVPTGTEAILTNPPFKIIGPFIAHALDLCPRVIMLARLAFLQADCWTEILEHRGLARAHVFRGRLQTMHRYGWTGKRSTSAISFARFVWDRNHRGSTVIDRI